MAGPLLPRDLPPVPTSADIRKAVDAVTQPAEVLDDPKTKREYTFQFLFKSTSGAEYSGTFTNKILTIGEKTALASYVARLYGGQPYAAIDPDARAISKIIGHMSYSLVKKPKWADDLFELDDEELVVKLYEEVAAHEATFRGLRGGQSPSGG